MLDARTRIEVRTAEEYEGLAIRHIIPTLGGLAISKLRPAHVSELYARLLTGKGDQRALSGRTVHHVHRVLYRILSWAERMQLVERNVARLIDPPSPQPSEAKAISPDEVAALLAAADGTRWQPLFVLAFTTGARRGELLALTWDDVAFVGAALTIRRALTKTRKAGTYLKPTKNNSVRIVGLSPFALEALRSIRATQAADKLAAGPGYADAGSVFADSLGGWLNPDDASHAYSSFAKKSGISSTRLHSARHTAATLMLGSGIDPRTVAGVLGHTVASTTVNIYGHLIASRATSAVQTLGDELE
jgi:integrase